MNIFAVLRSFSPADLETPAGRLLRLLLCATIASLLPSCHDSPKTCFDQAVLNCNMLHGFAGRGMEQQLESPSVKLAPSQPGGTAPMTRKEVVDGKIAFVDESLAKVKKLRQTDDTGGIIEASIALQEYVLGVYRDDYQQLAKLYDTGAPPAEIAQLAAAVAMKHGPRYQTLSDQLTTAGKTYAAKHNIKVIWDVQTSPPP